MTISPIPTLLSVRIILGILPATLYRDDIFRKEFRETRPSSRFGFLMATLASRVEELLVGTTARGVTVLIS